MTQGRQKAELETPSNGQRAILSKVAAPTYPWAGMSATIVSGAVVTVTAFLVVGAFGQPVLSISAATVVGAPTPPWLDALGGVIILMLLSGFFWALGSLFVGMPVWWLLHRLGLRGRLVAAGTGALLVGGIWGASISSMAVGAALAGAICGAIAGLAFEGATYRGWFSVRRGAAAITPASHRTPTAEDRPA